MRGEESRLTCPACRTARTRYLWTVGDRLFRATPEVFEIRRCEGCALLFLWPPPSPAAADRHYPDGYWRGPAPPASGGVHRRLTELYRRLVLVDHVRFVHRVVAEQRRRGRPLFLLDLGCGDGAFLEACDVRPCAGLDPAMSAARAARARGLRVVRGRLLDAPFRDGAVSVVTMFHCLEHLSPPGPNLQAVRRLLAADGDLIVQVPNAESWQARLFGGRWAGLDVPRHLINYSARTLRAALVESGFEVVRESHASIRDGPATLANSLLPGLYPPGRAARGAGTAGVAGWAGDLAYLGVTVAALPFAWLESLAGHGAAIMMQARPVPSPRGRPA